MKLLFSFWGRTIPLVVSILALSLFSAATVFAAEPTINNVLYGQVYNNDPQAVLLDAGTPVSMYINIIGHSGDDLPLTVHYDYTSGLFVLLNGKVSTLPGKVKEEILNENGLPIYDFGNSGADVRSNGVVTLTWDGTCNVASAVCNAGDYVASAGAKYKLSIKATNGNDWNSAITYVSADITVNDYIAPTIFQESPLPPAIYDSTSNSTFDVYYKYTKGTGGGKGASLDVSLKVKGPSGESVVTQQHDYQSIVLNPIKISWNGQINGQPASAGDYSYTVSLTSTFKKLPIEAPNKIEGTFKIMATSVDPNPSPVPNPDPIPSPNPAPNPSPSPVSCGGFPDVQASDCQVAEYVKSIGAMTGYSNGNFGPDNNLNRAEIAKIVEVTFKKFSESKDYCLGSNPFPDVTASLWAFQYICRGQSLGMITGYLSGPDKGFYRPERNVNRAEFLALVLRNVSDSMPTGTSYKDVASGEWYEKYAKFSYDKKLFSGSYLYPTQPTRRIEVARVLYRLHELGKI